MDANSSSKKSKRETGTTTMSRIPFLRLSLETLIRGHMLDHEGSREIMDANTSRKKRKRATRTTTMSSSVLLPGDIEIEILRRLPVKSLLRFKCVCKVWYNLIRSLSFVTLYNNESSRSKITLSYKSHYFYYDKESTDICFHWFLNIPEKLTVAAPVQHINVAGCSHGLVCFSITSTQDEFVVWNPATRSHRLITASILILPPYPIFLPPYPIFGGFSHRLRSGFLFDPVTNTFKLSRISFIPSKKPSLCVNHSSCRYAVVQVDIFTSSENSWRTKKIDFPSQSCTNLEWGTCTERFMNWKVINYDHQLNVDEAYILGYDLIDELLVRVELPSRGCRGLIRYGEFLAVFVSGENCTNVWLINDSDGMDRYSLSKEPSFILLDTVSALGSLWTNEVDWVVLTSIHTRSWLCNLETGETMEFDEYFDRRSQEFFVYRESLASIF